jgi:hypothetical protein
MRVVLLMQLAQTAFERRAHARFIASVRSRHRRAGNATLPTLARAARLARFICRRRNALNINRRDFLLLSGCAMASFAARAGAPNDHAGAKPRIILFDAFPIFDPRSVKDSVEQHARNAPSEL